MAIPCSIVTRSRLFTTSAIFLSSTKYFKMSCDHRMLPVVPLLFPSLAKVSLCRKEIEDSRGVLLEQLFTRHLLHHTGNSLEKQYFSISRLPIAAATVIVLSSHSHCFTSLAHLRNSSLFVAATSCKTRLDLSPFHSYLSLPRACYSTPIPTSKWMNIRNNTPVIPIRLPRRTQAHPDSLYSPLKRKTDPSIQFRKHMRDKHILVMQHQSRPYLGRSKLQPLHIRRSFLHGLFFLLLLLPLLRAGHLFPHYYSSSSKVNVLFLLFFPKGVFVWFCQLLLATCLRSIRIHVITICRHKQQQHQK